MYQLNQLKRLRWAVRGTLVLGVAASVAANILHANPNPISQTISAWPPVALLLTVELCSRIPVTKRWRAAVRVAATVTIAGIAAWVSYWHMVGTVARYGESAAYLIGSALGRHPIAPTLSPRKTVEGGVAQLVVSIAAALALGAWLLPRCGLPGAAGAGMVLGLVGQVGDLAESAIKRSIGTKDTGDLIPGHGGALDRIDSLLFNVPALYFYSLYAWCRT